MSWSKGGTATNTSSGTTENQNVLPQWASFAQQNLMGQGQDVNSNFAQAPAYGIAGYNPDQMQAFNYARSLADWTGNQPTQANTASQGWAQTGAGKAAQLDPSKIAEMQNPYTQQVVDTTLNNMRDQYNQTNAGIGAQAAAGGSYGGSREAVQRSLLDKNYGVQVAQTAAQLESQGFDKAAALEAANVSNQQQTNLSNNQIANSMSQFNAGQANSLNQFNAGQMNAMQQQEFNQKQASLQNLLGIGNQQQQFAQSVLGLPNQALQNEAALTPSLNNVGGTQYGTQSGTSTQPMQDNTLGTILGVGASLLGLGTGGGTTLGGTVLSRLFPTTGNGK